MSAHTNGPWRYGVNYLLTATPTPHGFDITTADGHFVATTGMDAEADARLIAAAPELLAALKAIRKWLLDTGQLQDDGIAHPLMIKANNLAAVAIAKAEGLVVAEGGK